MVRNDLFTFTCAYRNQVKYGPLTRNCVRLYHKIVLRCRKSLFSGDQATFFVLLFIRKKTFLNVGRFFRDIVGTTLMNVSLSVCTEDKTFFLFVIKQYVQNVQSSFDKIIKNKPKCFACSLVLNIRRRITGQIPVQSLNFPKEILEKCVKGFLKLKKLVNFLWFDLPLLRAQVRLLWCFTIFAYKQINNHP